MLKKGDYCIIVDDDDYSLVGKICFYMGNSKFLGYLDCYPYAIRSLDGSLITAVKEVREATAMDLALEGL
jgi:hypothetical protein